MTCKDSNIYGQIRKVFQKAATPGTIIGRCAERAELETFLKSSFTNGRGGSLYISGPPGTGKTSLVADVLASVSKPTSCKLVKLNCMGMRSASDALSHILRSLDLNSNVSNNGNEQLKSLFLTPQSCPKSPLYLIVLDEIDHLLSLDSTLLFSLFEWSTSPKSRLTFIGLANALDLTDRFLPALKASNVKPRVLLFQPYGAAEIQSILISRLKSLRTPSTAGQDLVDSEVPFMHPAAIEFCSRKATAAGGDLRKAFEIMIRTANNIEERQKGQRVRSLMTHKQSNEESPEGFPNNSGNKKIDPDQRATIADVCSTLVGMQDPKPTERLKGLSLHQRITLWAIVRHNQHMQRTLSDLDQCGSQSALKGLTISTLNQIYRRICKEYGSIEPLSNSEILDTVSRLEVLGLISSETHMRTSLTRSSNIKSWSGTFIVSHVDMEQFAVCFEDKVGGALKSICGDEDGQKIPAKRRIIHEPRNAPFKLVKNKTMQITSEIRKKEIL